MRFAEPFGDPRLAPPPATFMEMLEVETLDTDLFRAPFSPGGDPHLYGGQVAAQALRAAAQTVPEGRTPHSLHGYFVRPGDTSRPVILSVHRDRDGRSFSARRVEAVQDREVIFSASCSFAVPGRGRDEQVPEAPTVSAPEESPPMTFPRLIAFEGRSVEQPHPDPYWPVRFWARITEPLGDDAVLQACALTYLSDISSGLALLSDEHSWPGSSLDHAVWFHRRGSLDEWTLVDLAPQTVSGGRGWYTGNLFDSAGRLIATTVQESLFRLT